MPSRRLFVKEHGPEGAPRVVLVHGAMDRSASFVRAVRHLGELRVIRYDRRGFGRSLEAGPPTGLAGHVTDLLDIVGEGPAVVVGHSYGGVVAVVAAISRPERIRAVGTFEAPRPWESWWPTASPGHRATDAVTPESAAEVFMRRLVGDRRWEGLPERTRAARRAEGQALLVDLLSIRGAPA